MPQTLQIALYAFYVVWLIALLVLLYLIYRSSEKRLKHIQSMELTLFDVAKKDAETARQAVDAIKSLVATIQKDAKRGDN
jgi:hypothetical protein